MTTPRDRILAAVAPYLEAHAVTGPFAVGETRYDVRIPPKGARPWLGRVTREPGHFVYFSERELMFPEERFAKMALLAALEVWLAIQAEEVAILRRELEENGTLEPVILAQSAEDAALGRRLIAGAKRSRE